MSSIWKGAYESALRDSMKDWMWYQGYKEWYIKNGNNLPIFRQNMFNDLERKKIDHQINKSLYTKKYQQKDLAYFCFMNILRMVVGSFEVKILWISWIF